LTSTTHTTRATAGSKDPLDQRTTLGRVTQRAPRRLGQWAASIVFVVLVVSGLVALFESQGDRVEVLVVTGAVPAGQVVDQSDLRPVEVAGVPGAVLARDIGSVVGKRAAVGLVDGQVLTEAALTAEQVPGTGERLVALLLTSGRVPGGLGRGDVVDVLAVPGEGAEGSAQELQGPKVLAESARVDSVGKTPEGARVVTIVVDEGLADPLAAYSAAGRVTIVQAPIAVAEE
jgi:hypothetical protein